MITVYANINTSILEFIEEYDSYKFLITDGCNEHEFIESGVGCDGHMVFNINWDLILGIYNTSIYGVFDGGEIFIKNEIIKVINPLGIVYSSGELTDEYNYPLTDEYKNNLTS